MIIITLIQKNDAIVTVAVDSDKGTRHATIPIWCAARLQSGLKQIATECDGAYYKEFQAIISPQHAQQAYYYIAINGGQLKYNK